MNKSNSEHIKALPSKQKNNDSKTKVYTRLCGGRTIVSVRIKPELKEALKRFCLANGLSLCHVYEALTTGYLQGVNQKIDLVNLSPTINLNVERVVKRHRRVVHEYGPEANMYDPNLCDWVFVKDVVLNEKGHAVGCACKVCREVKT